MVLLLIVVQEEDEAPEMESSPSRLRVHLLFFGVVIYSVQKTLICLPVLCCVFAFKAKECTNTVQQYTVHYYCLCNCICSSFVCSAVDHNAFITTHYY